MEPCAVTVWSDYLCPYCWVSRPRVTWLEEHGAVVDWQPYELHPEIPREGVPRERLTRVAGGGRGRLLGLASEEGVRIAAPRIVPNTRLAHEAAEWIRSEHPDVHADYHDCLFVAHWEQGADIGDLDVLADLAAGVGIDAPDLRAAVAEGLGRDAVEASRERALDHGVAGTPAFLFSRRGVEFLVPGLQDESLMRRVLERIGRN